MGLAKVYSFHWLSCTSATKQHPAFPPPRGRPLRDLHALSLSCVQCSAKWTRWRWSWRGSYRHPPEPGICDLEADDVVLLYTDGVTEARTPDGELFGLDRLADLLEREAASGLQAGELLRRLVRAVLDHQAGGLRDDATLLLLVQWTGT
jgi:hypothetical protein